MLYKIAKQNTNKSLEKDLLKPVRKNSKKGTPRVMMRLSTRKGFTSRRTDFEDENAKEDE